jgi:hypothetical protein
MKNKREKKKYDLTIYSFHRLEITLASMNQNPKNDVFDSFS